MNHPSDDPAEKVSFSLPGSLLDRMVARMNSLGIKKKSEYIQRLISEDVKRQGPLMLMPSAPPAPQPDAPLLRVAEDPPAD